LIEETRMNGKRMSLIASAIVFAGSVHAQGCSGGPDGGMGASGNQCSDPGGSLSYTTAPARVFAPGIFPVHAGPSTGASALGAMQASVGSTRAGAGRGGRLENVTRAPVAQTRVSDATVASCSGGSDGGMDASGNQCTAPSLATATGQPVHASGR
jgi:hypothetical protein